VTDPRGTVRTYNFTTILGVVKSTGQSQPAGSGCAASAAALTYDANGNIATRTDFNGNKTTYVYDLARNTETSRTEGLTAAGAATASTRTITTSWHPTWRLPLSISEYAGATASGTPLKTTTYVYDSKGNITSVSEADPVNNKTRTTITTYTYSTAVPGLVLTKVVDGPRTDVSDITTYQYYPHDATCADSTASPIIDPITGIAPDNLGCRGQLMSVTNALGQSTTYDRYNHHGQVEQMTDANGLVTTYTYDLRQRILSHTAGTEQTSYQYDNVGQLTQLTLPDGSYLNYTWDAAHRLTDITDSLSNHIHYTLDTEGNRTQEDITDPNSVLTKTLSRSYDALSRMQQLTGIE
jgi:YD repeat-containing protein